MKATATIFAELDHAGRTVIRVAAGSPPLGPRVTGPAQVHLAATAGGPLGGDDTAIDVRVGAGATLTVRTVGATVLLPGTGNPSRSSISAEVAGGGCLVWLPEPMVAATGCSHVARTSVSLGRDAHLLLREELIAGRHDEASGLVQSTLIVERDGVPVLAQTLVLGDGASLTGVPSRAVGSLLTVAEPGTEPTAEVRGPWAVVMPLAHPGASLVSVLANDARSLRTWLEG